MEGIVFFLFVWLIGLTIRHFKMVSYYEEMRQAYNELESKIILMEKRIKQSGTSFKNIKADLIEVKNFISIFKRSKNVKNS